MYGRCSEISNLKTDFKKMSAGNLAHNYNLFKSPVLSTMIIYNTQIYFSAAFAVIFYLFGKRRMIFPEKSSQCNTAIAVAPIKAIDRLSQLQKHVGPKSIMISMCGRQTEIAPVFGEAWSLF